MTDTHTSIPPNDNYVPRTFSSGALDPADALPGSAREKFVNLGDDAADLHAAVLRRSDELRELRNERDVLERHIATLREGVGGGGHGLDDTDPRVSFERKRADELTRKITALAKSQERDERWRAHKQLLTACENYIRTETSAGRTLRAHPAIRIDGKGDPAEAINQLREKLTKLRLELDALDARPVPIKVAKQRLHDELAKLAEHGRPNLRALLTAEGGPITWAEKITQLQTFIPYSDGGKTDGIATGPMFDSLATFAFINKAQLATALEADLAALTDDAGVDDATRTREFLRLHSEILSIERQEAALIARSNGEYRADCDPRAVLGLG